ncbi:hypothetical protein BW892_20375 [Bacillus cereus]|uniref:Uncharacterized protein n=1 Tax=Bacillus cereus TaxID=1396 RepID=A0A1S9S8X4_BACCE|nr:hypothetical protein BW898_16020 [Bacillus cereus]OOR22120.1 hypothetical protein BW892_20375 [Bacillus cereus]
MIVLFILLIIVEASCFC